MYITMLSSHLCVVPDLVDGTTGIIQSGHQ